MAEPGWGQGVVWSFGGGELHGEVADRGAFGMSAADGQAGAASGEIGKKTVAAGAPDDVDAGGFSIEHLVEVGDCAGIAGSKALKDYASEERLVSGNIGNERVAVCGELFVDTSRHISRQEQRLGVDADDLSRCAFGGSGNEIVDCKVAAGSFPMLHALLQQPHAVDVGVEAESTGGRALVGVSRSQCL